MGIASFNFDMASCEILSSSENLIVPSTSFGQAARLNHSIVHRTGLSEPNHLTVGAERTSTCQN